ncbi:MAG: hypothetical protein Q8J68_09765 [Methanolobus sp.]|uniref:hypothetical protein n=1 Tax=Methanolobus sp. TaxID=1874737 RepID=UPI00272FEAE7|nr:hypothetical protein [Methanolobus sp.]MDP2217560.1 hypothetical protein [Methanolobus sp.]
MEKSRFPAVLLGVLVLLLLLGGIYLGMVHLKAQNPGGLNVSSSRAVNMIETNPAAAAFISDNFKVSSWRATKTTLIQRAEFLNSTQDDPDSNAAYGDRVWKVEIMERTCACPAPNELYVVEGYVDADTGNILYVKTMKAPEKNYEKETCASTACH